MAVPEQTPYIEHTGNGSSKSFSLGFQCESKDHLIVLVDEIEPPIATWSLTGGNVVFTTAPAAGKKIKLQRNTPFSRTTDYQSYNNSFRPPAVNKDFDWIWLKLQELGVADWILGARIDALKNYVDRKDDELKAYLMEEIRKQGVALDQLENYYNYLMQQLAQIAVNKGWLDSFVVTWSGRTQEEKNKDVVHIKDFGAKANGVADDTLAVKDAIASGRALDWGDETCVYKIDQIEHTATADLNWMFRGAKIVSSDTVKRYGIKIELDGFDAHIDGINYDAKRKSFTGLYFSNIAEKSSNIYLDKPNVKGCYRQSTLHTGGDGIYIVGNFDDVFLSCPKVKDTSMGAGAGISGSQGVSGITVVRHSVIENAIPRNIMIFNPNIEDVYCEDTAYTMDQDGIRVFTRHSQDNFAPQETSVRIIGGRYKNCMGRSIKSQSEITNITDPTFIRTRSFDRGYGNHEIDCQTNGGLIRGIDAIYKGGRPDNIVYINSGSSVVKNEGNGLCKVRDVKIAWDSSDSDNWLTLFGVDVANTVNPNVSIDNVEVRSKGTIGRFLLTSGAPVNSSDNLTLSISNSQVKLRDAVLNCVGDVTIKGLVSNFRNTHATARALAMGANASTCLVAVQEAQNITYTPQPSYIPKILPTGDTAGAGFIYFDRALLTANTTVSIPLVGQNNSVNLMLITIASNRLATGLFAIDNNGILALTSGGTGITTGNTVEPASGDFRMWVSDGNLMIKNSTANTRRATLQRVG
nr:MAG TPA_asm: tail spike protein [Caudoviricetes sp.]